MQHCLLLQTKEIFINSLISQTYASLPNRGIHLALKTLREYLKNKKNTKYCLKIDIHHFYPSINREVLKKQLSTKFKDKDVLWLMNTIIDSMEGNKGIAIGSLASQYFGNFYLSKFDHWLKEKKKQKYILRYCDDVVVLSSSKEELYQLLDEIKIY
ncbi:RNA-directed DNA polymerase, partial [Clostridium sp. HV4-5-A1G]|uniref:RNA-directed DNA polymerase n=1 Tax=Clostridium sp. HV4-5-A1G TaxID=2004595 RepID=UPI0022A7A167